MLTRKKGLIFSLLIILSTLPFLFPINNWLGILLTSVALQAVLGYVVLFIIFLFRKQVWLSRASLLAALLVWLSFPAMNRASQMVDLGNTQLKVAHFNVLKSNKNYDSIISAVRVESPDLVSFQEVTYDWAFVLKKALSEEYQYHFLLPQQGSNGIAIFSKLPVEDFQSLLLENEPGITGTVCVNNTPVSFIAFHAANPIWPNNDRKRNRQLMEIATYLNQINGPKFAIGDFNTVPWDENIRLACATGKLQDSRTDLTGTYPSYLPMVRIPIDYILHNDDIYCHDFRVIDRVSSDHLGIVGVYSINPKRM